MRILAYIRALYSDERQHQDLLDEVVTLRKQVESIQSDMQSKSKGFYTLSEIRKIVGREVRLLSTEELRSETFATRRLVQAEKRAQEEEWD
jgi:hypothetical protein